MTSRRDVIDCDGCRATNIQNAPEIGFAAPGEPMVLLDLCFSCCATLLAHVLKSLPEAKQAEWLKKVRQGGSR